MKDLVIVDKAHDDWSPKHIYDKFDYRLKMVKNEEMLLVFDDIDILSKWLDSKGVTYVVEHEGDDVWFYLTEIGAIVNENFDENSKITPMFEDFEKHVPGQTIL